MIREIERPNIKLNDYYVVRVVDEPLLENSKKVVKEFFFDQKPTDQEIVEILLIYSGCFVSVVHNYRLEDYRC